MSLTKYLRIEVPAISPIITTPQALKLNKFGSKYKSYANALMNNNTPNIEQATNLTNSNIQTIAASKIEESSELLLLVQSLNNQVQLLTTLLEDIYESTIF